MSNQYRPSRLLFAGLMIAAAACGPASEGDAPPPEETTIADESGGGTTAPAAEDGDGTSVETTSPSPTSGVTGEVPQAFVDAVLAHASESTGSPASAFEILRAEEHEWPDGSLGCPEPDTVYPQVITPGYQLVLELDGREFDYRLDDTGFFRLCESAL